MAHNTALLCDCCQSIFTGHWMPKKDVKPNVQSDYSRAFPNAFTPDIASQEWNYFDVYSCVRHTSASHESYEIPLHHQISTLKKHALTCPLCSMLFDLVDQEVKRHSKHILGDDLQGVLCFVPFGKHHAGGPIINLAAFYFRGQHLVGDNYCFMVTLNLMRYDDHRLSPPLVETSDETDMFKRSIAQISSWMSKCQDEHDACKPSTDTSSAVMGNSWLPTRFLHLSESNLQPIVALRHAKSQTPSSSTKYATLSHCWGKIQPVRLLQDSLEAFQRNIDFTSLPWTFQHAILLCLKLGICYLWIDSLCIIQDSKDDWLAESITMGKVYSQSFLNIAGTSSKDGMGGLFKNGRVIAAPVILPTWTGVLQGRFYVADYSVWGRRIDGAVLNSRAWVLQERLLAPRTVHFASDQVWWTCINASHCNEQWPNGCPPPTWSSISLNVLNRPGRDIRTTEWTGSWMSLVQVYSRTNLTKGSDKLIALSGIAEAVYEAHKTDDMAPEDYLAGIWRAHAVPMLCWQAPTPSSRPHIVNAPTASHPQMARFKKTVQSLLHKTKADVPEDYRAPSWSWASVDGRVGFPFNSRNAPKTEAFVASYVDAKTDTINGPFGPVSGGWIKLQGPLLPLEVTSSAPGQRRSEGWTLSDAGLEQMRAGFFELMDDERSYERMSDPSDYFYACLVFKESENAVKVESTAWGLLLKRDIREKTSFVRVGWLRTEFRVSVQHVLESFRTSYIIR